MFGMSAVPKPGHTNRKPDVIAGVALAKCEAGDTAAAIPDIEHKLIGARVELPRRG
jgi:hypothetical protein